jgi:hypothetical protein
MPVRLGAPGKAARVAQARGPEVALGRAGVLPSTLPPAPSCRAMYSWELSTRQVGRVAAAPQAPAVLEAAASTSATSPSEEPAGT